MEFRTDPFENYYELGENIGDGFYAEVKKCWSRRTGECYAAKLICQKKADCLGLDIEDINREIRILVSLRHENVITLHEAFHNGSLVILVLELVKGGELFEHVSDTDRLSEEEASQFVKQILLGVEHMHANGIMHLDLKPENIMIEDLETKKIKLIDFGLARPYNPHESFQGIQGTADYVAPEIINFDSISYATDMWAIGVITYMLLSGLSPFGGDTQQDTFDKITRCKVDLHREEMADVSDLARDFLSRLLIKNQRKRATVKECLNHPWIQPIENKQIMRRRSSIIRTGNLHNLKHFVVMGRAQSEGEISPTGIPRSSTALSSSLTSYSEQNGVPMLNGQLLTVDSSDKTSPIEKV